jgi:hypothetical protein
MAPNLLYASQALEKAQTGTEWLALAHERISKIKLAKEDLVLIL